MAKRRRFPQFRSGDLPADSQCREFSISGQYPAWPKRRFPGKPTLRTTDSALGSGGGYPAGGRSPATTGRPGAPQPPLRSRPMHRGNITGLGLRRSNSRRSRIPAFSPTCRPFQFRFPEHDWNKESLSSNSFRTVGRRPDKFALSDPVEADAATCGLRAIGAVVVQIEQVEDGRPARSISAKFKAAAGWRGPRDLSAAFAPRGRFPTLPRPVAHGVGNRSGETCRRSWPRPTSSRSSSRLGTNRFRMANSDKPRAMMRDVETHPEPKRQVLCWYKPRAVFHLNFKLL